MKIVVSHQSAFHCWQTIRVKKVAIEPVSDANEVLKVPPRASDLEVERLDFLPRPIHVLVSQQSARRLHKQIVNHYINLDLSRGSICYTEEGFYICSPELCISQMSSVLQPIQLIELCFEFCGTYISEGSCYNCAALTSVDELVAFVDQNEKLSGVKRVRRILKYVVNGSASPMETKLEMMLCLPHFMGGYGLEKPEMNYRVDLNARARRIAGKSYCKCDLYWPKYKLALEYDGEEFHGESEQMLKDSSRRNALIVMGIAVISATRWDIQNAGKLNVLAHTAAKHMGKRLRYKDPQFTQKHLELRKALQLRC